MTGIERVSLEPAYVLHGRAYRETSELLEVFTRAHGRASLVAKGMRRPGSGLRAILQPFQPLAVSWSGRGGGLLTLRAAEAAGPAIPLGGTALMSGFYVNELLIRFLHRGDPHPGLYSAYATALGELGSGAASPEPALRRFELALLAESGYGLNLDHDAASGEPLDPACRYQYMVERGPVPVEAAPGDVTYSGAELLAIGGGDFADGRHLQSARRLLRDVLDHYLGGRPLRTREVFNAMKR